jgi:acyl-CoA thioesterase
MLKIIENVMKTKSEHILSIISKDIFAKKLGIEFLRVENDKCYLKMEVLKSMCNGLGFVHNSILYTLAETAFYVLANSNGKLCLTIDTNMSYPSPVAVGDTLIAFAEQLEFTDKTGLFDIIIRNQNNKVVGLFRGTVFISTKEL